MDDYSGGYIDRGGPQCYCTLQIQFCQVFREKS